MKLTTLQAAIGSASLLFFAQPTIATHGHRHAHEQYGKRHAHSHQELELVEAPKVEKRATCSLPSHPDLVPVPGGSNNGFAMSPDQSCTDGTWCPIACVSGKVMAQWEPNSSYVYPQSMNGGLYCNGGEPEKAFPDAPYCVDGTGTVSAVNNCGKVVSFCQTVLPGNEAMLIPTDVTSTSVLAVPGPSYWAGTAAHYYINPPGVSSSEGCIWGDESKPIGNWSPYVAGANTDSNGQTFVKIAWNPIFTGCGLSNTKPSFGVKIECPGGGCNGLPCSIDPSTDGMNGVDSPVSTEGVGGADFCVVTVPKGSSANIVVFNTDGSTGNAPSSSKKPVTSAAPTTSSTPTSTQQPTTSTTSTTHTTSSAAVSSSTTTATSTTSSGPASSSMTSTFLGGIFHENSTYTATGFVSSAGTTMAPILSTAPTDAAAPVSTTSKNEGGAADQGPGAAIAGLIVALVAAAALY
ncbi:hypothetical protein QBC46DRAFT_145937 [Diplogelasinospora grovesii]|uniref:Uncharacterized protein n=1 Tax=Diplogelasinospora grovesii TaxID=303347 RepID=A0AAN6NGL6_9PEZI|nr:hypothetical protein QBC46DRAFT_145937 [Diplogelasinospora grovesii]